MDIPNYSCIGLASMLYASAGKIQNGAYRLERSFSASGKIDKKEACKELESIWETTSDIRAQYAVIKNWLDDEVT